MIKHILLAEDDEDDIELFRDAIAYAGLPTAISHVHLCDGILNFEENGIIPDMIVLDGVLPQKNVLECIQAIKNDNRFTQTPLVVLSGSVHTGTRADCYKAGINLYLQKVNSFDEMVKLIKRLHKVEWRSAPVMSQESFYAL